MIRFHGESSVWPVIKAQIRRSKKSQQIFAAIAYVGIDATKLMPLRRGDVLVCNASDASIKQGSTSAIALEKFFNRGVQIFNEPRLHGKVVVFPTKAFVGSANVSSRSKDVLIEAVVETTDSRVVDRTRRFVKRHSREVSRIDRDEIQKMRKIKVKKPTEDDQQSIDTFSHVELPKQAPLLKLIPISFGEYSKAVKNEIANNKRRVRDDFFAGGPVANVTAHEFSSEWWKTFQAGMWYAGISKTGRIYKPMKVIKLTKVTKRLGVVWLAVPRGGKNFIKDPSLLSHLGFDWESDRPVSLRDGKTRMLLSQFRET